MYSKCVNNSDYSFKIVFSGDKNTGKTALIARYEEDKFIGKYSPTIGIEFVRFVTCRLTAIVYT
jgi:GTPase SAR1 family protein